MQNRIWMSCAVIGLLSAAPAPTGQQAPVDLVVVNAKVLTVDPKNTQAEAVAIRGNTFAAVGTTAAIRKMAGPADACHRCRRADCRPRLHRVARARHRRGTRRSVAGVRPAPFDSGDQGLGPRSGEGGGPRRLGAAASRRRDAYQGRPPAEQGRSRRSGPGQPRGVHLAVCEPQHPDPERRRDQGREDRQSDRRAQGLHAPLHAEWRVHGQDGELPVAAEHSAARRSPKLSIWTAWPP